MSRFIALPPLLHFLGNANMLREACFALRDFFDDDVLHLHFLVSLYSIFFWV